MNCIFSLILLTLAALASGCGNTHTATANEHAGHHAETHAPEPAAEPDKKAAFKAALTTLPAEVKAGAETTLVFTVKDAKGATVKNLQIVHEKPMHLLIVSSDLAEFEHVHPEPQADGSYQVKHKFPNGGNYRLYADFTPPGAHQIVDKFEVTVAGTERARVELVEDKEWSKKVDTLNVTLKPEKALKAGDELMLNFFVNDATTGKPVTDLQKYLGELAHFVVISQDLKQFLHVHPMSGGAHGGHKTMTTKAAAAPTVSAHTAFPQTGLYKLWAQFQRNGQIITVPFTVRVGEGAAPVAKKDAAVPAGAIKITVSQEGYTPESVTVKAGQPVKLAFTRQDANNCGGEVVFPKLNIRQKLPVGKTVLVELTPQEAGELTFACGMNMYRGKVIVQ
jgi:plastocyanin